MSSILFMTCLWLTFFVLGNKIVRLWESMLKRMAAEFSENKNMKTMYFRIQSMYVEIAIISSKEDSSINTSRFRHLYAAFQ